MATLSLQDLMQDEALQPFLKGMKEGIMPSKDASGAFVIKTETRDKHDRFPEEEKVPKDEK